MTIGYPATILLGLAALHYTSPSSHTEHFFHLPYCAKPRWYHNLGLKPKTGLCTTGIDDAYFVVFGILMFTMIRAAAMTYIYMPLGRLQGIRKPKPIMRFAEQAWGFTFAVSSWSAGMVSNRDDESNSSIYSIIRHTGTTWMHYSPIGQQNT